VQVYCLKGLATDVTGRSKETPAWGATRSCWRNKGTIACAESAAITLPTNRHSHSIEEEGQARPHSTTDSTPEREHPRIIRRRQRLDLAENQWNCGGELSKVSAVITTGTPGRGPVGSASLASFISMARTSLLSVSKIPVQRGRRSIGKGEAFPGIPTRLGFRPILAGTELRANADGAATRKDRSGHRW